MKKHVVREWLKLPSSGGRLLFALLGNLLMCQNIDFSKHFKCCHLFSLKPKKTSSTSMVTAGLTDEQLKAGWAPADIEYPYL